ncbi:ATP-binding protein, partial [candidate division KSB1 bacterium]|nr:ATP-binding protein [Phycisphaerae bacterium]NIR62967.1 ATP-binding protein [candidate division Zixibacteria bacterium]NIT70098.1 ATP-binding protein [candidate division KSB1 bacterium]NIS44988.1 ATP-binding protein [candidate division Zixibacteria bacterium]NIU13088.1 ATP-binding protein [candidate division Zixibacteria bacterium]
AVVQKEDGTYAEWLPLDDLWKIINAKKPTIVFFDDAGQAPTLVQAAMMQLVLARRIGLHKVSEYVTFIAATNRKEDMAGVGGMIEPLKGRFRIYEMDADVKDWIVWAYKNDMPHDLIAFI